MRRELLVDDFAGGGGASEGIRIATGRGPDIAINHDDVALGMHAANHPDTLHITQNIWKVDPDSFEGPIGLLWASPDCKHFSKAKGGKPADKNIRNLAWVVVRWARRRRGAPRVIILENVEEFATWGPLGTDGRPCPERMGRSFKEFVRELKRLGYAVEWRNLCAADYGAPTIRKRLFLIARRDGQPIVWPLPTHGAPDSLPVQAGRRMPWRTASEIIDWSLPCPSIFDTSEQIMARYGIRAIRPLAPNTMARIARGVKRYVLDAAEPFIVPITHTGDERVYGLDEPARTVTTAHRGEQALVTPVIVGVGSRAGQSPERSTEAPFATVTATKRGQHALVTPFVTKFRTGHSGRSIEEPMCTVTANSFEKRPGGAAPIGLVAAFLAQHNTDMVGHHPHEPVSTIVQKGCTQAVVSAGLMNLKGSDRRASGVDAPGPTQTAGGWHISEVRAFLMKYHRDGGQAQGADAPLGTGGCKARFGVITVMVGGEPYAIVDIGMRMLTPRELFRAQGFSDAYIIDRTAEGDPITKTDQIRMCGNSVCPQVAAALVSANYVEREIGEREVPAFALQAAE